MKRIMTCFLATVLVLGLWTPAQAEYEKTKIAVLDFQLQGSGYETEDMGSIVAEWLITALVQDGRFEIVERRLLEKILQEQQLVMSGVIDDRTAMQLGKLLGVKIIVSGSVLKFQDVMEVNARIIDVGTASIIAAENVRGKSALGLEDLVVRMADKIIKDFPIEGYVVNRDKDDVIIDLGKLAGVKTGMRFVVYKEGKVIKHPKTGEVLDVEEISTGTVEVVSLSEKIARCRVIDEAGTGTIKYGQQVKSLSPPDADQPRRRIGRYVKPDPKPAKTGVQAELAGLDAPIAEIAELRKAGNRQWKATYKTTMYQLKLIYSRHPYSADVYYYYALAADAGGNWKATYKYVAKAVHFRPNYYKAYLLRGTATHGAALTNSRKRNKLAKLAYQDLRMAAKSAGSPAEKAAAYFALGSAYEEISGDTSNAQTYWKKAVETAPGSAAADDARQRLDNPSTGMVNPPVDDDDPDTIH